MQKSVDIVLEMQSYIAHPYWPARNKVIEIQKKSGVNRQKSEEKREAALKAECARQGITFERYHELLVEAAEQWYRAADRKIMIPRHQLAGAIVETIGRSPKALRGMFDKQNFRALIQIGDFRTVLTEPSGIFRRFVKLETSNQRNWQENEYIGIYLDVGKPFSATGKVSMADHRQEDAVKALLTKAVEDTGVGAARKMGFGRGRVLKWGANGKG